MARRVKCACVFAGLNVRASGRRGWRPGLGGSGAKGEWGAVGDEAACENNAR